MADYIVKDTELTSVANAIRTAGGTSSLLTFPNGFTNAINNISGGGSSDFSTATVTVVTNETFYLRDSVIVDDEFGELITNAGFESYDYPLLLYKSEFASAINPPEGMHVVNATGSGGVSVSASPFGYEVTITGDGTLNVTLD